jgi:MFS family permease
VDVSGYRALWRDRDVRTLLLAGIFARMPHLAAPLTFTLHVLQDLDGSYAQAGVVAAASTVGAGIGSPWRGRLVDRLGVRRAVVPSIVVVGLLYPVAVVAPYWALVPVAFGMGLFLIPVFSITRQSLSVMVPEEHRRAAFSIDNVLAELSFIVGPAVGILLVTQVGAAAALGTIGACEVVAGFALLWLNPPTRSQTREDGDGSPVRWFSVQIGFLFLLAVGTVFALIAADLGIIATLEEAGDTGAIALVYALWGGASLLGGLLYGAANTSIRPTYLLLGLGLTTIPVGLADSVLTLSLAIIPTGFLCAPTLTASTEWIARLTPEQRRGEAMGWHGSSFTAGGALAAPTVGTAIDHVGPWGGFALGGVVAAGIAIVCWVAQLRPVTPAGGRGSSGSVLR